MIIMSGGFSSRSTTVHLEQFPQRDEAIVSGYSPEPGFSNSDTDAEKSAATIQEKADDSVKDEKPVVKKTASKKG